MMKLSLQQMMTDLGLSQKIETDRQITGLNTLQEASPTEVSFLENKKYLKYLGNTRACAVFVSPDNASAVPDTCIAILCEEPYVQLAKASAFFAPPMFENSGSEPDIGEGSQIQTGVYMGKNVRIGKQCMIMSGCHIGDNVSIGDQVRLYPNVVIYRDCKIGSHSIIHAGTVIGSDGFGFAMAKSGEYVKIYQNGNVIIGEHVEIGSNTTVDRAAFGSTIIDDYSRIDNLVQIAHNCIVGKYSVMASQSGLSGSTVLQERVIMAGQTASTGHLTIAANSVLAGRAVATKTVKKAGHYAGFPLMEHRQWLKMKNRMKKLISGGESS